MDIFVSLPSAFGRTKKLRNLAALIIGVIIIYREVAWLLPISWIELITVAFRHLYQFQMIIGAIAPKAFVHHHLVMV